MSTEQDPARMANSREEPESLRSALRTAKLDGPTGTQLRHLASALAPQLGSSAGTGGAAVSAPKVTFRGARWLIASGVILGGVAIVAALRNPPASAPEPRSSAPVAQPSDTQEPPAAVEAPVVESAEAQPPQAPLPEQSAGKADVKAAAGARVKAPPVSSAPTGETATKPSEATLLDAARNALHTDARRALALTAQHRELYPRGILAQEREVIAIEALRRLGQSEEAQKRNREFESSYPTTIHGREIVTEVDGGKR